MSTLFPIAFDSFTNPSGSDATNATARTHSQQHGDLNDAVEAVQARIGVLGSTDPTCLDNVVTKLNMLRMRPSFPLGNNAGTVIFGDASGDSLGNVLRPQDHIVVTPLAGATLTSATKKTDAYGGYYELIATGSPSTSSGYLEFEVGYDQQQFNGDTLTVAFDTSSPVNLMSVSAYMGVLANYTINASQTLTIGAGSHGAYVGRMHVEFRSDAWTKTGYSSATELQNFRRVRLYFTIRQSQTITLKVREIKVGTASRKGTLSVVADDYYHSFVRRGVPILSKRGIPTSLALIPAAVGAYTAAVTLNELRQFVDLGNECVVHGPSTGSNWFTAPYLTLADRLADVRYARDYIVANKLGSYEAARTVCYPQGVWQSGVYETDFLDALKADGFLLGRATATAGPNGRYFQRAYMNKDSHALFTLPTIGHSYAGAANTSGDATETANIATLTGYIQNIGSLSLCGILNLHHIVDDGAANQTYHCEVPRLITLADAIKTEVDAGRVVTQLMSEFAKP